MVEKSTRSPMLGLGNLMGRRLFRSTVFVPRAFTALLASALIVSMSIARAQETARPTPPKHISAKGIRLRKIKGIRWRPRNFRPPWRLIPGLVRARYQLGVCWFAQGKTQEARQEFERCRKGVRRRRNRRLPTRQT